MKRSSLAWYVAVACLGGSLCVGSVVQADSPTTVKANPVVPTAMVAQVQSTQPTNSTAATNTVANTVAANSEPAKAAVVLDEQIALKQKTAVPSRNRNNGTLMDAHLCRVQSTSVSRVQCGAKSC